MTLPQYIDDIHKKYQQGNATEHSYRGSLELMIKEYIAQDITITNEPKRQKCGAPDYILTKNQIPIGFIEAKDIGDKDLEGKKENKEQFDRYKASLNNIIFTDYIHFYAYQNQQLVAQISLAEISPKGIKPKPENFPMFEQFIKGFFVDSKQTITSSQKLASMMANKARLLADIIEKSLLEDAQTQEDTTLKEQMNAFKAILIHDITEKSFADVYAQTIAYGMLVARLNDSASQTFSRQETYRLIPKSNPFLKKLFGYIAGLDLDDRIVWIVDSLVDIFLACDVAEILKDYGKHTRTEDPIIHFYENFLSEYDPQLRKARGVWYTPAPVVNFIVRAVHDLLKTEFNLPKGLADTSTTEIQIQHEEKTISKEVHKVQILDPATGTGTFLAEVVKNIHQQYASQQGIWQNYVEKHLLPRLNGFEILMASYAMAHLQLDLLLAETGFKAQNQQRFNIYLTNSLEEIGAHIPQIPFAQWLSQEANEANRIKRDCPVMVVIGNPPYSISSSNKNEWIEKLIFDYKKNLNERKINLDDDYIKFIRFGEYFINKNNSGILAYISNNSFIDGITHRQMRKQLLESFDKIYILDLHGNIRKKEVCPDGSVDHNVFDIMQGVSINLFIKTGKKKLGELGEINHYDLFGKREEKYNYLLTHFINTIKWTKIKPSKPYYFFVPKQFGLQNKYDKWIKINELFITYSAGIKTKVDHIATDFNANNLAVRINDIISNKLNFGEIRNKYGLSDTTTWEYKPENNLVFNTLNILNYNYRPFDVRKIYYSHKFLSRSRKEVMQHLLKDNICLSVVRQSKIDNHNINTLITKGLVCEDYVTNHTFAFLLYLYPKDGEMEFEDGQKRIPNLNMEIVEAIAKTLGVAFTPEKESKKNTFSPIDVLDYIYAVLHSPTYRETYKEFLKIDFPRVPYPKDKNTFWELVKLGGELRQIHLLESPKVEEYITSYPIVGNNEVEKISYQAGKVFINEKQYFDNVPEVAWNFYIGGYQPAQKWLKDRKGKALEVDDIFHYQKIIVALSETARLMHQIDEIKIVE